MRNDDDIFESLNISGDTEDLLSSGETAAGGELSPESAEELIFEELDMEDRIFSAALDEGEVGDQKTSKKTLRSSGKDSKKTPSGKDRGKAPRELNTADSSVDRKKLDEAKKKKKKSLIKKIIIASLIEVITLTAIFTYGYFLRSWNLIQRIEVNAEAVENTNLSVEKKEEMEKGYWNIAVFGVDSRSDSLVERGLNSDVIIIVSINKENGDIKLVSVFRDTYLNISENNLYSKINAAYSMGGPEQALAAINKNLDLNITEYVVFNWKAVVDGINILGGVDGISISKAELYYINAYITETVKVTGIGSYQLTSTGEQHLDGVQAVAYARLRYMDNDYARTERQRNVIKACFEKAKKADFAVLNNIMVVCFPQVATNVNFNNIVAMAQNATRYNIVDTAGFPWQRGEAVIGSRGDCVVPATLESNVVLLHEFLFGIENYTPTDAVLNISETIKANSKIYKEGQVITSVSTDGGVIQSPKTASSETSSSEEEEDESTEPTIGVDENGRYIYPTDEDGDIIYPTDEDGDIIYPTDEDGNIIRESTNISTRPTDLAEEGGSPGEAGPSSPGSSTGTTETTASSPAATSASAESQTQVTPVQPTSETESSEAEAAGPGTTAATEAAVPAEQGPSSGEGTVSEDTSSETSSSGPGGIVSGNNIISADGPGSVTITSQDEGDAIISDAPQ